MTKAETPPYLPILKLSNPPFNLGGVETMFYVMQPLSINISIALYLGNVVLSKNTYKQEKLIVFVVSCCPEYSF